MRIVLWTAFAAMVVLSGVVLLRACGLSLGLSVTTFAWNFCPATPSTLSAEAERGTALARLVRGLELEIEQKLLACASIPPPPPPPLELPTHTDRPRPQQTALLKPPPPPPPPPPKPKPVEAPKPPPAIPADRWANKDLGLLEGCWRLGRDGVTDLVADDGTFIEKCAVKTGSICFGTDGQGRREAYEICPSDSGPTTCRAPITASFGGDGRLYTKQPHVMCDPPVHGWSGSPGNDLVCDRVSDDLVMCSGYEFRR